MNTKRTTKKKAMVLLEECVACGCCQKVCPRQAISIYKGMFAAVAEDLCIGCGLCHKVCPADVIAIIEKEEAL